MSNNVVGVALPYTGNIPGGVYQIDERFDEVMLDLETMGTGLDSPIIAIGAFGFSGRRMVAKFYAPVRLASCMPLGAVIDPNTVLWWMQQSDEARSKFQDNETADSIGDVLGGFREWLAYGSPDWKARKVWGNGSEFDNVILHTANKALGREPLWPYWNNMSLRNVKVEYPDIVRRVPFEGTPHYALDDAAHQCQQLFAVRKHIEATEIAYKRQQDAIAWPKEDAE